MIATLTFHNAINYGAILQAYALQRMIQLCGYETEIFNYNCPAIQKSHYEPKPGIKSKIAWAARASVRRAKLEKFNQFKEKYLSISKLVSREDLYEFGKRYDSVVVGSDQVWNTDITDGDRTYFLDFVPAKKKKAYAASIGLRSWDASLEPELARAVSDFSYLTVRENSSAEYLSELIGYRPQSVCDPVFLLTKEEWLEVAVRPDINEPYVLCYSFGKPSDKLLSWSKAQALQLGAKLVLIHFGPTKISGAVNVRAAGPEEFLGWLSEAQLVVSSSFHACAFSIIFEKNFCWFVDEDNKLQASRSGRIEDLLKDYNLTDRKVCSSSLMPVDIEYSSVVPLREQQRSRSINALEELLK